MSRRRRRKQHGGCCSSVLLILMAVLAVFLLYRPEGESPGPASDSSAAASVYRSNTGSTISSGSNGSSAPASGSDGYGAGSKNDEGDSWEKTVTLEDIPAYAGSPYTEIHDNVPFFNDEDLTAGAFESYSDLDALGRCGTAFANVCRAIMPTEKREEIGSVRPTGWHTVKYEGIDGNYLYNRCHLIGYQLSGENANEKNLITGTRYMNVEGMEPFENMVADYVKETDGHVLYRVTPLFEGNNQLASGVLMEAESEEDRGGSILFNVFCYNVQPGITIDYADGSSSGPAFTGSDAGGKTDGTKDQAPERENAGDGKNLQNQPAEAAYIGNRSTGKFHRPDCRGVARMSDANKVFFSTRKEAVADGYEPCGICHP